MHPHADTCMCVCVSAPTQICIHTHTHRVKEEKIRIESKASSEGLNDTAPHIKVRANREGYQDCDSTVARKPTQRELMKRECTVPRTAGDCFLWLQGGLGENTEQPRIQRVWLHGRQCLHWTGGPEASFWVEEAARVVKEGIRGILDSEEYRGTERASGSRGCQSHCDGKLTLW